MTTTRLVKTEEIKSEADRTERKKMDFDWIKLHVASTPMKMKSRISPNEKFNIFVRILEEVFL